MKQFKQRNKDNNSQIETQTWTRRRFKATILKSKDQIVVKYLLIVGRINQQFRLMPAFSVRRKRELKGEICKICWFGVFACCSLKVETRKWVLILIGVFGLGFSKVGILTLEFNVTTVLNGSQFNLRLVFNLFSLPLLTTTRILIRCFFSLFLFFLFSQVLKNKENLLILINWHNVNYNKLTL